MDTKAELKKDSKDAKESEIKKLYDESLKRGLKYITHSQETYVTTGSQIDAYDMIFYDKYTVSILTEKDKKLYALIFNMRVDNGDLVQVDCVEVTLKHETRYKYSLKGFDYLLYLKFLEVQKKTAEDECYKQITELSKLRTHVEPECVKLLLKYTVRNVDL